MKNFIRDFIQKVRTRHAIEAADKQMAWLKSLPKNVAYTATRANFGQGGPMNLARAVARPQQARAKMRTARPQPAERGRALTYEDILKYATNKARSMGAHPAVVAGQMGEETGHGTSSGARDKNNYLSMMAYDNKPIPSFDTPESNVDFYFKTLSTDPRYTNAWNSRSNPSTMLEELKKVPYATNPNYVNNVRGTREWRQYGGD